MMKKILILIISLIGTLALTGCDKPTPHGSLGCVGNTTNVHCAGAVGMRMTWKSTYSEIDLSATRINLTESSVTMLNDNGTLSLSIKNSAGSTIATSVFDWYSVGNMIYLSNPSATSSWLNNNLQNDLVVFFDIEGISFSGGTGTNSLIAVFEDGFGSVGYSDSFYMNDADLNGF